MPRLVSGIQPTGNITLGNYLGAIKNFVKLQDELPEHEFFIFIADLHAITIFQDREKLRKNIKSLAAIYLACGLRPDRVNLFIQSEVPMHSQLGYIMECNGMLGELERMTQYKDKKQKQVQEQALIEEDSENIILDCERVEYDTPNYLVYAKVIISAFTVEPCFTNSTLTLPFAYTK